MGGGAVGVANNAGSAGYDLHKLRGRQLLDKPARPRRYTVAPLAAHPIAALLTPREYQDLKRL